MVARGDEAFDELRGLSRLDGFMMNGKRIRKFIIRKFLEIFQERQL